MPLKEPLYYVNTEVLHTNIYTNAFNFLSALMELIGSHVHIFLFCFKTWNSELRNLLVYFSVPPKALLVGNCERS